MTVTTPELNIVHRLHRADGGFTLMELMVVLMTIGVLLSIAIPSFVGFRKTAQDRSAQATLTIAEKHARGMVIDNGASFPSTKDTVTFLLTTEPVLVWVEHKDPSTGPGVISVDEDNGGGDLNFAVLSDSGTCWYLRVNANLAAADTSFDKNAASCEAHDFQGEPSLGWEGDGVVGSDKGKDKDKGKGKGKGK